MKTAYEKVHGQPYHGEVLKFGQPILARNAVALEQPKLEPRWQDAVWLGKSVDTECHIAGNNKEVTTTRTCKPLQAEDPKKLLEEMIWAPWGKFVAEEGEEETKS